MKSTLAVLATLALAIAPWPTEKVIAAAARSCEDLKSVTLADTVITSAQVVEAGAFTPPGGGRATPPGAVGAYARLPAFCRVAATVRPSSDSDIKVEIWLPQSGWNQKFQAVGNGGWAGTISYPALAAAIGRGYASASTDTGHSGDASFALNHPEKVVDFAYRAVHEMTLRAKTLINAY